MKILYAFRNPARYDQKRMRMVLGECMKLNNRERDLYGYDICVMMAQKQWKECTESQRYKLMWHELYHIDVLLDEAAQPSRDDYNRIRLRLRLHDLNMERFSEELDIFGFNTDEASQAKKLVKIYRKHHPVKK